MCLVLGCGQWEGRTPENRLGPKALIPGPGSTFDFAWADYDSAGIVVHTGDDTLHFVVLDTGLTLFGRKSVSKMLGFMGDTLYVAYDRPNELQYTSHLDRWPGWQGRPQIVVRMDELPISSTPADAWWYSPEVGFIVRFAAYEVHDNRTVLRVSRLVRHKIR
jgi:hypothetical protein